MELSFKKGSKISINPYTLIFLASFLSMLVVTMCEPSYDGNQSEATNDIETPELPAKKFMGFKRNFCNTFTGCGGQKKRTVSIREYPVHQYPAEIFKQTQGILNNERDEKIYQEAILDFVEYLRSNNDNVKQSDMLRAYERQKTKPW